MSVDVILGLQWGDEGKGKIVDLLANKYDIVARFQGGPNAGHTIHYEDKKFVLHTIPSGISTEKTVNIIGNGVLIDPYIFMKEIQMLNNENINPKANLLISRRAHLITPSHRLLDAALEKSKGIDKIGSTLKGIGPTYTDKIARNGLRIGDLEASDFLMRFESLKDNHFRIIKSLGFDPYEFEIEKNDFQTYTQKWLNSLEILKSFTFIDSEIYINKALQNNKNILAEGAQGTLLDIDFGSYPFVTSSNTTTGGVCTGLGIPPSAISKVYGIFKAYCTRVGSGPFPTELHDDNGNSLRDAGNEYGSTTGRPRRCGWLDIPALKYSIMINGVTDLIITKSDVLDCFDTINVCKEYSLNEQTLELPPFNIAQENIKPIYEVINGWHKDITNVSVWSNLPEEFIDYILMLESNLCKPISMISTGPNRNQTIFRK